VVMTSAQKETGKTYDMRQVKERFTALLHRYLGSTSSGETSGGARVSSAKRSES
jgi:hypothetical protein